MSTDEPLWKLKLQIDLKLRKIVLDKFDKCLRDFCKKEDIKIKIYDTIIDLNGGYPKQQDDLAAGIYICQRDKVTRKIVTDENYPLIKLTKDYYIFTFAHEIGHHLALKQLCDDSEYIADKFIMILAEEYLTNIERYILSIGLEVYSGIKNYPLPDINKKDLKEFKKLNKL